MREFEKVMQDKGAAQEIESMFNQMQEHADQSVQAQVNTQEGDREGQDLDEQQSVIELGEGDNSKK